MPNHASVILIGHLGRDPKRSDRADVTEFSLATSKGYGEKKKTHWWKVAVWGKQGERCEEYLRKGSVVTVLGQFDTWERDGKVHLCCTAKEVVFMDGKPQGEPRQERRPDPNMEDLPF